MTRLSHSVVTLSLGAACLVANAACASTPAPLHGGSLDVVRRFGASLEKGRFTEAASLLARDAKVQLTGGRVIAGKSAARQWLASDARCNGWDFRWGGQRPIQAARGDHDLIVISAMHLLGCPGGSVTGYGQEVLIIRVKNGLISEVKFIP
jgi:hypothetical protein